MAITIEIIQVLTDDEYKYDDLPSMCETSDDGASSDEDIIDDDAAALNSGFPISSDPNRRNTRSHHNKNHNISTNIHQAGEKAGDNDVDEMDEKHIHNNDDEYDEKHVDINDINASYYDNSDAKASEPEADVNDIDYDDNYALENIIAHKYTATGGTNYLCQWDVGDKYTYSFEPNSSLKGQDLDAYNIYTNNLKHNKDETHLITDEAESKAGPILHEYQHDNTLIKDVYDARGWDHDKNTPIGEVDAAGGSETSFAADVNKKINIIRKRIRKIRKVISHISRGEERESAMTININTYMILIMKYILRIKE